MPKKWLIMILILGRIRRKRYKFIVNCFFFFLLLLLNYYYIVCIIYILESRVEGNNLEEEKSDYELYLIEMEKIKQKAIKEIELEELNEI
jgi:hypothetical protein